MLNALLLKQIAILSVIAGAILGFLTIFPILNIFTITILVICVSVFILVYMKRENLIGTFDLKEGAIMGCVIGFVSFISAAIVYIPLDIILGLIPIFAGKFIVIKWFFTSFGGGFVLFMLIFFVALLSALMNAFAGLAMSYVYELLSGLDSSDNDKFKF